MFITLGLQSIEVSLYRGMTVYLFVWLEKSNVLKTFNIISMTPNKKQRNNFRCFDCPLVLVGNRNSPGSHDGFQECQLYYEIERKTFICECRRSPEVPVLSIRFCRRSNTAQKRHIQWDRVNPEYIKAERTHNDIFIHDGSCS